MCFGDGDKADQPIGLLESDRPHVKETWLLLGCRNRVRHPEPDLLLCALLLEQIQARLGITIVGGLIVSQALTLFTTPVVYLFFDRLRGRFARLGQRRRARRGVAQVVAGD